MQRNSRELGRRALWVITRINNDWTNVFCHNSEGGGRTLPIFSFREEADTFLSHLGVEEAKSWQVKETRIGELISVLMGPCRDVSRVALDPPAPLLFGRAMFRLVSVSRERFMQNELLEERREAAAGEFMLA